MYKLLINMYFKLYKNPLFRSCTLLGACSLVACSQLEGTAQERMPNDAEVAKFNASVAPEDRIVCRKETPIGTNVPRRVCRYIRDIDATSLFHRDQLRRVLR